MITSPNMGLKIWNLTTDPYDSTQLAENLAKLDLHDHSNNKGVQIPTAGIADGAITGDKLASGALNASGDLDAIKTDYEFAFSTYKTLYQRSTVAVTQTAGTLVLMVNNSAAVPVILNSEIIFYIDPADFTANARVNKLRVRAQAIVNATAPTINFVIGLYPIATWGSASAQITIASLGAVVSGSTVAFNAPGASSVNQGDSGDFTAPAAGFYALGMSISGTQATNSAVAIRAELQNRQV